MFTIGFDSSINHEELVHFLKEVDNYFHGTLSIICKQKSLDIWAAKLLEKSAFITARDHNKKIVACMIFYLNNKEEYIYVNILAVLNDYRKKGLAHKIFKCLFDYAENNERKGVELSCHKLNLNALSLYKKIGFVESQKQSNNSDFIHLEREIFKYGENSDSCKYSLRHV